MATWQKRLSGVHVGDYLDFAEVGRATEMAQ